MLKEFRNFISRGNVFEMAIGVIIGGAIGKIVSSLVNDIIMPPIGLLLNKIDFENLFINLTGSNNKTLAEAEAAGEVTINYGLFINSLVDFIIITLVIFIVIKQLNRIKIENQKETLLKSETKKCPVCTYNIPKKARRCPYCTTILNGRD